MIPVKNDTGKKLDVLKCLDGGTSFDDLISGLIRQGGQRQQQKKKRIFDVLGL